MSWSYAEWDSSLILVILDSPQTHLYCTGWPRAWSYLVIFHIYSWITFVIIYIHACRTLGSSPACISMWLPLPTFIIYLYYFIHHSQKMLQIHSWTICPPEAFPVSCQWQNAIGSPFWGSGRCLTLRFTRQWAPVAFWCWYHYGYP